MANEITVSVSLQYEDSTGSDEMLRVAEKIATSTGKKYIKAKQSIGTSEEAINLGEVTSPGFSVFINRDPTNYVELRVATGGAKFATLPADLNEDGTGGPACLHLGSGAQAPYAIANTAACVIEYLIVSQ